MILIRFNRRIQQFTPRLLKIDRSFQPPIITFAHPIHRFGMHHEVVIRKITPLALPIILALEDHPSSIARREGASPLRRFPE